MFSNTFVKNDYMHIIIKTMTSNKKWILIALSYLLCYCKSIALPVYDEPHYMSCIFYSHSFFFFFFVIFRYFFTLHWGGVHDIPWVFLGSIYQ